MSEHYLTAMAVAGNTMVAGCRCGLVFTAPVGIFTRVFEHHQKTSLKEEQS